MLITAALEAELGASLYFLPNQPAKHHQIRSWVQIPVRFGDKAALLQNGGDVTEERGEGEN